MQKKIIALAVAGLVSGAAFAQSNVTIYGHVDAGYNYFSSKDIKYSGINDGGTGGLNTSRIGFKGEEALGNGLKALFTLEYGLAEDTGVFGTTARQSFVGLQGKAGTVSFGRQYSPSGTMLGATSSNGIGSVHASNYIVGNVFTTMQTGGGSRWDNSVVYQSPMMSGFSVRAAYSFGEKIRDSYSDASTDASKFGVGVSYANGPVYATAIYQQILADDANAADDGNKSWAVGGSYDFKVVKVYANYIREHNELAKGTTTYTGAVDPKKGLLTTTTYAEQDITAKYYSLGVTIPVSTAGTIQAEYAHNKYDYSQSTTKGYSIGYVHNLSKRTAVYTAVSRLTNDDNVGSKLYRVADTTTDGESVTGFAVGVRHSF